MKKLRLLAQLPEGWEFGAAGDDTGAAADPASLDDSGTAGDAMIVIDDGASLNEDPFVILPSEDDMQIVIDDGAFLGAYLDENGNLVLPDNGRMMDGWEDGNWCILPIWDGEDFVIDDPAFWIDEPVDGGEIISEPGDEAGEEALLSKDDKMIFIDDGAFIDVMDGWDGGWWCELPVWEGDEAYPVDVVVDGSEEIVVLPDEGGDGSEPAVGSEAADGGDVEPVICICYPPEFFLV